MSPTLFAATLIRAHKQQEMSSLMSKFFRQKRALSSETQPASTTGPFSPPPLFPHFSTSLQPTVTGITDWNWRFRGSEGGGVRGPEGPLSCFFTHIDSDKWSTGASLAWLILNNGDSNSRTNHHDQSTDTELEKCHKRVFRHRNQPR